MPNKSGSLKDKADALYRAAAECHRRHTSYSSLVDKEGEGSDEEQREALEMAFISDDALATAMTAYESAKDHVDGGNSEEWWHKSNMLWHASKEYIRRHANCEGMSKRLGRQSRTRLAELTLSFDLEASALLALRMAADSYRSARPELE
ncbi:MAG TPA: hypothetical protein VFD22_08360 [Gemmatimonadaceae bacterium]|nr:hypothetical protein [Gemmatimonadaceae bacterium]